MRSGALFQCPGRSIWPGRSPRPLDQDVTQGVDQGSPPVTSSTVARHLRGGSSRKTGGVGGHLWGAHLLAGQRVRRRVGARSYALAAGQELPTSPPAVGGDGADRVPVLATSSPASARVSA